jgi:hypothetical protein
MGHRHLARPMGNEGQPQRSDIIKETALVLSGVTTKELLRSHDLDPKTGKLFRDCRYCRLLCEISDAFVDEYMSWHTDTGNGMHLEVGFWIREAAPLIVNCIGCFTWDKHIMYPRVDLEMFGETSEAFAIPGTPTMGLTLSRVMDTRDPPCLQFAKDCIRDCQHIHLACVRTPTNFVPTQLLHLGSNEGESKLCKNLAAPSHWVALSHCWGGSKPLNLLKSNMADPKQNINPPKLYSYP